MKSSRALAASIALLVLATATPCIAATDPGLSWTARANRLIVEKNYLGFRVFLKKAYQARITYGDWYGIQGIVNSNADKVGYDLIQIWNARVPKGKSNLDKTLEYADSLMLTEKFEEAFVEYQKMAKYLKKTADGFKKKSSDQTRESLKRVEALYPSVLHSMARALYGAGRYLEALEVYRWITPAYPELRQVLFERMWAAFRAGKVEESLGAIASQRSVYFSRFLSPEAYLIQVYIYRKLCRKEDLEQLQAEMKAYEQALSQNGGLSEWANNELETRLLSALAAQEIVPSSDETITTAEIEREKKSLNSKLLNAFKTQKPKILSALQLVNAYAQLASLPKSTEELKPVEKLNSRAEFLAMDRELWPVDGTEEWADEIGNRYFIGDSQCSQAKR